MKVSRIMQGRGPYVILSPRFHGVGAGVLDSESVDNFFLSWTAGAFVVLSRVNVHMPSTLKYKRDSHPDCDLLSKISRVEVLTSASATAVVRVHSQNPI